MKKISLYLMAAFYFAAGVNHFVSPDFYLKIMPTWLPAHVFLIQLSGVIEIALGIALIPQQTRRFAAWLIIAMLVAFLPLHIDMMVDYWQHNKPGAWLTVVRIPIQFLLIYWAKVFTK